MRRKLPWLNYTDKGSTRPVGFAATKNNNSLTSSTSGVKTALLPALTSGEAPEPRRPGELLLLVTDAGSTGIRPDEGKFSRMRDLGRCGSDGDRNLLQESSQFQELLRIPLCRSYIDWRGAHWGRPFTSGYTTVWPRTFWFCEMLSWKLLCTSVHYLPGLNGSPPAKGKKVCIPLWHFQELQKMLLCRSYIEVTHIEDDWRLFHKIRLPETAYKYDFGDAPISVGKYIGCYWKLAKRHIFQEGYIPYKLIFL